MLDAACLAAAASALREGGALTIASDNANYAALRAVTKLHGAFKVRVLCARRGAGVFLNVSGAHTPQ